MHTNDEYSIGANFRGHRGGSVSLRHQQTLFSCMTANVLGILEIYIENLPWLRPPQPYTYTKNKSVHPLILVYPYNEILCSKFRCLA